MENPYAAFPASPDQNIQTEKSHFWSTAAAEVASSSIVSVIFAFINPALSLASQAFVVGAVLVYKNIRKPKSEYDQQYRKLDIGQRTAVCAMIFAAELATYNLVAPHVPAIRAQVVQLFTTKPASPSSPVNPASISPTRQNLPGRSSR
jgi:hypothetical protein